MKTNPLPLVLGACLFCGTASGQHVAVSRNFLVEAPTRDLASRVLERAEEARVKFGRVWLGRSLADWTVPVCVIADPHAGPLRMTNGTERQFGTRFLLVELHGHSDDEVVGLVAHEVGHAVIDSEVEARLPVPRWMHEGACVAFEGIAYRTPTRYHKTVGRTPLLEFMNRKDISWHMDGDAFYNQGTSLAHFVRDHWGATALFDLYREARGRGWELAVLEVCGMTLTEFEQFWLDSLGGDLVER